MAGAALNGHGQIQLESRGFSFLLKPSDASLVLDATNSVAAWALNNFNPNQGLQVISYDTPLHHRSGSIAGPDVVTSRKLEFSVVIRTHLRSQMPLQVSYLSNIAAPLNSGEATVSFQIDSTRYVLYGRFRGAEEEAPEMRGVNIRRFKIRFDALDPIIYGLTVNQLAIPTYQSAYSAVTRTPTYTTASPAVSWSTTFSTGGSAPPRWSLSAPATNFNPGFFCRADGVTDLGALWCNNRVWPDTSLSGFPGQYELTFNQTNRTITSPGTVPDTYWSAWIGPTSRWWRFDTEYGYYQLAYIPRITAPGTYGGAPYPSSAPAGTSYLRYQSGYWSI